MAANIVLTNTSRNRATWDTMTFQNVNSLVFTRLSHMRMRVSRSINADRKENDDMKMDRAASFDCLASSVIYYMVVRMQTSRKSAFTTCERII
jgi:hypothetical protein